LSGQVAVQGQRALDRLLETLLIEHGERARETCIHVGHMRVGFILIRTRRR
jgi:hypothetical protein